MSSYQCFAQYYDKLTNNIPYDKRGEYFHALLQKNGISSGILVDLACGTGSLSEVMSGFGYDVIGVDGSEEMLSEAINKRYESASNILYLCQTMQELDLYGTIDACICALDSLNHITDSSELQIVFNKVSMFLNPGGLFLFDVNTPYKHQHVLSNNVFVYDYDEIYCVWQNSVCENNLVEISLDLFCRNADGRYAKQTEGFKEQAYTHQELMSFLEEANLELVGYYGDDSFEPPQANCERAIYVARSRK